MKSIMEANLLPSNQYEKVVYSNLKKPVMRLLVLLIVFVILKTGVSFYNIFLSSQTSEQYETDAAQKQAYEQAKQRDAELDRVIDTYNRVGSDRKVVSQLFEQITKNRPAQVRIRQITFSSSEIAIEAVAPTAAVAGDYYNQLKGVARLEKATLQTVKQHEGDVQFRIVATKDQSGKGATL